ncbi:hypothetical protein EI42_05129 [Thermosporothrix hazakensis]|uniref:Uncharacterized protein n=1 Tax=Thermosporothrix hazakensis TaxID=644383 RepID=A0A326UCN9_THEHA|nr:hypothetical protein EI42_05129 [Thermosporothrix hazakensis]
MAHPSCIVLMHLVGNSVPCIIECCFNVFHGNLVRLVVKPDGLCVEVNINLLHARQAAKRSLDCMNTVIAAHIGDRKHYFLNVCHVNALSLLHERKAHGKVVVVCLPTPLGMGTTCSISRFEKASKCYSK